MADLDGDDMCRCGAICTCGGDPGISLHSVSCNDPDCPTWEGAGECMDPGEYDGDPDWRQSATACCPARDHPRLLLVPGRVRVPVRRLRLRA